MKKKIIITILSILVIGCLGCGSYFYLSNNSNNNNENILEEEDIEDNSVEINYVEKAFDKNEFEYGYLFLDIKTEAKNITNRFQYSNNEIDKNFNIKYENNKAIITEEYSEISEPSINLNNDEKIIAAKFIGEGIENILILTNQNNLYIINETKEVPEINNISIKEEVIGIGTFQNYGGLAYCSGSEDFLIKTTENSYTYDTINKKLININDKYKYNEYSDIGTDCNIPSQHLPIFINKSRNAIYFDKNYKINELIDENNKEIIIDYTYISSTTTIDQVNYKNVFIFTNDSQIYTYDDLKRKLTKYTDKKYKSLKEGIYKLTITYDDNSTEDIEYKEYEQGN